MSRILQRIAVIAWAVLGFVGFGCLLGALWLERTTDRSNRTKPTVQFVSDGPHVERECPPVLRAIDAPTRAIDDGPDAEDRRRAFRVAQLLTLIEAGVASAEREREFCAAVEEIPDEWYERLMGQHPSLPDFIAEKCGSTGLPTAPPPRSEEE